MLPPISDIHPELQESAAKMPAFTFTRRSLKFFRAMEKMFMRPKKSSALHIENVHIPTNDGKTRLRLRIYRPKAIHHTPAPVLVWFHGGGYIVGRPESDESRCIQFARDLGIVIVSVSYRYAPEHPFPTPLEDGYTALKWVAAQAGALNVDLARLAVGGVSAGGGLAAALAQLAYDRGEIVPVFQLLVYPMLDDRTAVRSVSGYFPKTWSETSNRLGWELYLGQKCGAEDAPPYAVPARRENLAGLPPAWIGVGTLDLFYDEDLAYARRLEASGTACDLEIVPGAFHGFDVMGGEAPVLQVFYNSQAAALRKHLLSGE